MILTILFVTVFTSAVLSSIDFLEYNCIAPLTPKKMDSFRNTCCNRPVQFTDNILVKCFDEIITTHIFSASNVRGYEFLFSNPSRCMAECLFREVGLLKNEKLQLNSLETIINNTDPMWSVQMKNAIEECHLKSTTLFNEPVERECSYVPVYMMGCIDTLLFMNCPDAVFNNTEVCNEMRQFGGDCSFLVPVLRDFK